MKKLNAKRIIILIVLIIMIIIEFIALKLSRAQNIKEVELIAIDINNILQEEKVSINAIDQGKSRIFYSPSRNNK